MFKWADVVSKFQGIVIRLPRCYLHLVAKPVACMLYGFCDASTAADAAVVYLCVDSEAHLVASKTRVSPLTQQTLPRLELLSCLLLARLTSHVLEALQSVIDVKMGSCFTDSRVALNWIQGEDKQWKQFVHNRAVEICKLVPVKHWRHCAGKDNPADMPSRGITPKYLDTSLTWRHGPDWLPKFSVTKLIDDLPMPEDCIKETRSNVSRSLLITAESTGIWQLMDCQCYSKLYRLLRVKEVCSTVKLLVSHDRTSVDWMVSAVDMESAEKNWIRDCQKQLATEAKFELWKSQLGLFLDKDNIW